MTRPLPPRPPRKEHKRRRDFYTYCTVGFTPRTLRIIDALKIKGHRGLSGKVRYLVDRAIGDLLEEQRRTKGLKEDGT